jgi:hypothetical protein
MSTNRPTTSFVLVIARVFWMLLGPGLMFMSMIAILQNPGGWFTPADFAFLILLNVTILARWLEFRGGDPRTATGEPATPADLRRYIFYAMPLGVVAWIIANLIASF